MSTKIDTKELIRMMREPLFEFVTRACAIAYICQTTRDECLEHVPCSGNVHGVVLLKFSMNALETFDGLTPAEAFGRMRMCRDAIHVRANAFQDGFIAGQVSK